MNWVRAASTFTFALAFLFAFAAPTTAQKKKTPKWSYKGKTGPQKWATLSSDYAACKGNRQSPINLKMKEAKRLKKSSLKIQYESSKAQVMNRKRSTQVNATGGLLTIGSTSYTLQQFHVHVPAEHTVKGKRHAAEIHLVHQTPKNRRAVIALFIREGNKRNPALKPLVEGVEKGQKRTLKSYNARSLFPSDWRSSYYRYRGSLTAPPCTENVHWVVLSNPIQASKEQLKALRARHKGNNRPVQPRHDRRVWYVRLKK